MAKQLVQLTTTQQCTATVKPVDSKGNPAQLESAVWSCSDETVASIVPSEDGLSCEIIANAPGGARVVCNGDSETGEGKKPVVALVSVTVVAGQAQTLDMEVTDPVEQGTGIDNTLPGKPSRPSRPGNALPGKPSYPSTGVPPNVAGQPLPEGPPDRPDAGLPGQGGRPNVPGQGLPGQPGYPSTGVPPPRPDAGLPPGAPNRPDAGLPPSGTTKPGEPAGKPDAGLPPTASPKK